MSKAILVGLAVTGMLFVCAPSYAGEVGVDVVFTDGEASIIRAYYRDRRAPQNDKKGRAKGLPPGIARNLQRGKALPPGIAKRSLPTGLVELLPPPPPGYERIELSGKVLLVEVATQVIHDVLEDAIIGK